ncbi:ABC transporter ATP-binding protein [Enterococcus durans]|uniref:ABC transporter ATP-binding protein n=1 Tax=Enterococcus durans TaxID=53345 RepID=UPI000F4E5FFA|nr:ABC transporter ATP-binding protein [Enterococcus durans]ROX82766.1 ABC transporter ATP-binding protein [Enterococcus durans]
MSQTVISITHLKKEIELAKGNLLQVLDDISFKVHQGEFVSIVGPSGSGKSTLLYCISSLLPPTKGEVEINGKSPYKWNASKLAKFRRKQIGFIFQDFQLLPSLSAYDNMVLPGILNGHRIKKQMVYELAKRLKLDAELHQSIDALSGGEQQKVAIARTVLANPDIIFLDEPTSALDTYSRIVVMDLLKDLVKKGKTIVMVTHDLELATQSSRAIVMKDGNLNKMIESPTLESLVF